MTPTDKPESREWQKAGRSAPGPLWKCKICGANDTLVSRAALADGIARILHDKETIGARELDLRRWLDEYDSLEGDVT